jgi:c-di-GMP-binding flagellar brake protein YcgR
MAKENGVKPESRRKNLRIQPSKTDPIRVDINGDNFIDILNAVDISLGGIGIFVSHGFKGCHINNKVSFVLELHLQKKRCFVEVAGQIKHVSGTRFGVCFENLSDSARAKIRQYIVARLREESLVQWLKYKLGIIR